MVASRRLFALLSVIALAGSLAACGDTWQGLKKDTGENLEKTGEAIKDAGESVKK